MLRIQTLGGFRVWMNDQELPPTAWTREKALHLLQLLITLRRKRPHKEQIIDLLWPDLDPEKGDRDFRVALNALQNALEPDRASRSPSRVVIRSELNYSLNLGEIWIDVDAFEEHLTAAHRESKHDAAGRTVSGGLTGSTVLQSNAQERSKPAVEAAVDHYQAAIALYHGDYLPERRYEDWTTSERERLHTLALSAMTHLAEIFLPTSPLETLRLTRRVLELDPLWENAYRIEMQAHLSTGNRPMAIRAYKQCERVIRIEFGLEPLPETRKIYRGIVDI